MKLGKVVAGGLVGAAMLAFGGAANAAPLACPAGHYTNPTSHVTSGGTTAVSNCEHLPGEVPANTVASIANINSAGGTGFFGFSDWADNGQTQINQPDGTLSGTWSIANVNFVDYDYIIVFKDGANTNLIAFLFNETASSGDWTSPFTNPPFAVANPREVSHITIARRATGDVVVPEPASLALLGMGLLGLGYAARRRRAH